ncbi:PREDICTED: uncharacterized protein LOC106106943 [Papilio polytes]|uniref:uncharacterized protein LOC106106943 n=1 Tax=Papilio polytes TaxID=76194 RepID=UPI0006763EFC|nr:PREDICTED: uncharacterized protein LOC106106943 [Papilio polytes]
MEKSEVEKICLDDGPLSRSRSFKTKQLVRSQAIRESQSPPHTSPAHGRAPRCVPSASGDASDTSSPASDIGSDDRKKHVEIQISGGGWECEQLEQRQRAQLWPGRAPDLLSYNPRVACVCGACGACPQCKGRRRKPVCPKQDSGIVCSDECPDCSDSEQTGSPKEVPKKSASLEADDTYYCRCPERKEKPRTILLNRTDSDDKLEPTGPELVDFIKETLNKNSRDRLTLLKIEKELHNLVNDTGRCIVRFPVMTSYGRMLVHRCAALFQLSHHIDQNNKTCVMVSKTGTSGGRIPCTNFKEWCTTVFPPSPQHRRDDTLAKSILKRSSAAGEEACGAAGGAARSKSLEQREREYERVRRRIFSSDNCTQDETQWPWLATGPVKLLTSEGRNKLIKVQSLESRGGESARRGAVSKSHSFGGYAAEPPNTRLLSKQGDLASSSWRLSPSSSGYKTLSLRSTDSVTPSPTGGASPEPGALGAMGAMGAIGGVGAMGGEGAECAEGGTLVWAVTDLAAVPPGALVIHPQTGRPLTNPDGSVYHFDPANPPIVHDTGVFLHNEQYKIDPNNEKRRGRLEKQHSFMDNECECQSEECRTKCCCECRRQDSAANTNDAPALEEKTISAPPSPSKSLQKQTIDNDNSQIDSNQYEPTDMVNNQPTNQYEHQNEFQPSANQYEQKEFQPSTNQYEHQKEFLPSPIQYEHQKEFQPSINQYEHQKEFQPSTNKYENQKEFQPSTNQYEQQKEFQPSTNKYEHQKEFQPSTNQYDHKKGFQPSIKQYEHQKEFQPSPMQYDHQKEFQPSTNQYEQHKEFQPSTIQYEHQKEFQPSVNQYEQKEFQQPNNLYEHQKEFQPSTNLYQKEFHQPINQYEQKEFHQPTNQYEQKDYHHQTNQYEQKEFHQPTNQYEQKDYQHQTNHYEQKEYHQQANQYEQKEYHPRSYEAQKIYDPNESPMSMSNVVYPSPMPQGYPYVNQCRMDAPLQPVYPQLMPLEEHKHAGDNTFRIDPSYPYAADFSAACGACAGAGACDPAMQQPPRGYNMPYGQVEMQQYPVGNVLVPQQVQHYPIGYGEAVQWGVQPQPKLLVQELYPVVYPNVYPQYNVVYPPNPIMVRNRILRTLFKFSTILKLLSFITVQMLLYLFVRRPAEDTQLTSAARAIVNSIRSIQARNNYHHDGRRSFDYSNQYRERGRRHDREDKDKPPFKKADTFDGKPEGERRFDGIPRNRNFNPLPFQYRPPYLLRQMSPGAWCRRSPGPVHPVLGHPRRPHPDTRNGRR